MPVLFNASGVVEWLNNNYWWPIALFLAAAFVIVKILLMRPRKKADVNSLQYAEEIVNNLGGLDNIILASIDGSRVKFQVREIESANLDAFKAIGATGVFISGKNVKMVLPFDAKDLVDKINSDINGGKI